MTVKFFEKKIGRGDTTGNFLGKVFGRDDMTGFFLENKNW